MSNGRYVACLIGETTGGLTAVQVYRDDHLVWSMDYFSRGATNRQYIDGLRLAYNDMAVADTVVDWDCGDRDDDGEPVDYLASPTAWIVATCCGGMLRFCAASRLWDTQSVDFVRHNADRIDSAIVAQWLAED